LNESPSKRAGNNAKQRTPLQGGTWPAIVIEETASQRDGGEQSQANASADNGDTAAEVAGVKSPRLDANTNANVNSNNDNKLPRGGRVAERMKELGRFAEQSTTTTMGANQELQQASSTQGYLNQRQQASSDGRSGSSVAPDTGAKVEADEWFTLGRPIAAETIEGFTRKIAGRLTLWLWLWLFFVLCFRFFFVLCLFVFVFVCLFFPPSSSS
jgi:hypothetical protein